MALNTFLSCESKEIIKMRKYQLPNHYKRVGLWVAVISFLSLFVNKFSVDLEIYRIIARYGLLIGMLLISISKEKVEDEFIAQLRMQSFSVAFILGVLYTLILPLVDYSVDLAFGDKEAMLKNMGDFSILWILLSVQVLYFELLKRGA